MTIWFVKCLLWANGVCPNFVRLHGSDERVRDDEDFSGDGHDRDFRRFALAFEGGVKRLHLGAVPNGRHGRLIQPEADFASTAADVAEALFLSAIAVERGQADQGRDRLPRAVAEFGEVGDQRARDLVSDAGDRLQDFIFGSEGLGGFDDPVHPTFEVLNPLLEIGDVVVDVFEDFRRRSHRGGMTVVFLDGEVADELTPPVVKVSEFEEFLGFQGPNGRGDDFAEVGQHGRIDGVGLGESSESFGEIPRLAGVDNDGGQALGEQRGDGGLLIRSGRFHDDPLGDVRLAPRNEFDDPRRIVRELLAQVGRANVGIEGVFADVDADEGATHGKSPFEAFERRRTRPVGFPVPAGECELHTGDYSN